MINSYFRDYTSLHTGNGGEKGYKDITLSYTFFDQDYSIPAGKITSFTTSKTLYPFSQLNVNDTTFVKDGAFGSSVPYLSDKIYKIIDPTAATSDQHYLVTWLSASTTGNYGVWVDRYYYPDIISRTKALSTSQEALCADGSYALSFNSPVQQILLNDPKLVNYIENSPVVDKISDLYFEPDTTYYYDRIGTVAVNNFIDTFNNKLLYKNFNNYYNSTINAVVNAETTTSTIFDQSKYYKYQIDKINETGSFVLKFDISHDWENDPHHALFGSKLTDGFSITHIDSITPFTVVHANTSVSTFNSTGTLLYTLPLPDPIVDVMVGDHLADYYVVTRPIENNTATIYKISPFGQIKAAALMPSLSSYLCYDMSSDTIIFLLDKLSTCWAVNLNTLSGKDAGTILPFYRFTTNSIYPTGVKYIPGLVTKDIDNEVEYPGWRTFLGNNIKFINENYIFHLYKNKWLFKENIFDDGRLTIGNGYLTLSASYCYSESNIYDYNIDQDQNLYVLHGENSLSIIDKNRNLKQTVDMVGVNVPIVIDFISEFTSAGYKFTPVIIYSQNNSNALFLATLDQDYQIQVPINTGLSGSFLNTSTASNLSAVSRIKHLTNYNYNQLVYDNATLNFNLSLKNYFTETDTYQTSIHLPISSITGNTQSFIVSLNQSKGEFNVYLNGVLFDSRSFDSYKYKFNLPFTNDFAFGCTAFYNNQTLAQYLGQPQYYFVNRTQIDNFSLYSDELQWFQIQALSLENKAIDNLNLTLPCGQRNNIEEISRTFFFRYPYNKSESVNITIKNTNITNNQLQDSIKNNIILNSADILPAEVNINSITFKDFNK